jgi:LCP family protein required for cell wall assembly
VTPVANTVVARPAPASLVHDLALVPPSAINILLLGTDQRPGELNWRTDTIILLSINQETKTVGMLTIPRDLYVNIPGIGRQRINTADFYGEYYDYPGGGPNLIKQTVEQNLGVRVHYFVRGGFDGFRRAIDILGGIEVDVDCPLYEANFYDDYGAATLDFKPGVQTMDGVTALRYARSRYTTNDYDRGRRQRQVILAMWDKATSLNLLAKWPELYEQVRGAVQTDLGAVEMAALAYVGAQLKMDRIKSRAIDNHSASPYITAEGAWVLLPNAEKVHSLLLEFFAPSAGEIDLVGLENARIEIVSANLQAAEIAAMFLRRNGLNARVGATVSVFAPRSTIRMYSNKPATARRLANLLHVEAEIIRPGDEATGSADIVVHLGRDYNACRR